MREPRLSLTAWAGLLTTGAVLLATGATAAVLVAAGRADLVALEAVALGTVAGLLAGGLIVLAAHRHASALRALRADAVSRLQEPAAVAPGESPLAPERRSGRAPYGSSLELAELGAVLDALHLRVRLGDQVGERHRREAEHAAAGVFELLSGLVAAEEGARGQLAAELHDTVAQSLVVARALLAQPLTGPADLLRVADHVQDAEEQLRGVMARTRPPALREGDLGEAVRLLRTDLYARYALDVTVHWPQRPHPLPLASAITVYRFFQEGLLNVVKHADVDQAQLELVVEDDLVLARVLDQGPGFDPDAVRPSRGRHVGLGLLRERARLCGGGLTVETGPEGGVVLTLRLPRAPGRPVRTERQAGAGTTAPASAGAQTRSGAAA